jgi:hypothetical protein
LRESKIVRTILWLATGAGPDLPAALLESVLRARVADDVRTVLDVDAATAEQIVTAFERFVAQPIKENFDKLTGHDLVKRNPMIYTARGIRDIDAWIDGVLADKETSAIEAHLGTWLEEVARIISGGVKPAGGVDLQVEREDGTVELYAIQSAPSTKNSGGRRSDVDALKQGARPLRAARRHVELNIAVLYGRARTGELRSDPEIHVIASDEFWSTISGVSGFRARLLSATTILADLMHTRSAESVKRIRAEATALFGNASGELNMDALAHPPKKARRKSQPK